MRIWQCALPCCDSTESAPYTLITCVTCKNEAAHHVCSINTASELPCDDNLVQDALDSNIHTCFCSMECAAAFRQTLIAKEKLLEINHADTADSEKCLAWSARGDKTYNEARLVCAMAIGLQVDDGEGGKKMLVDLADPFWAMPSNKPSIKELFQSADRRHTIEVDGAVKLPRKTKRDAIVASLLTTGRTIVDPFLVQKVTSIVEISSLSRKRKDRNIGTDAGETIAIGAAASSRFVLQATRDYVQTEDLPPTMSQEAFIDNIQEEVAYKDSTTTVDTSKMPKLLSTVSLTLRNFQSLKYRGIPVNTTEAKLAMMKYVIQHRRNDDESGKLQLDRTQLVFHFKLKWKPEKLANDFTSINLYLRIVGVVVHPDNRELVSKLLSGKKNIDDADLSEDTIQGGWDSLAAQVNDADNEVPVPFADDPSGNSEAQDTVPSWNYFDANFDVGNSIPKVANGKAMRQLYHEKIIRPYRTLVDKWTSTETGNGGDKVLLSHVFTNGMTWLTYIFALDQQLGGGETAALFLYDRSGVVPAEFRVEEGAGAHVGGVGSPRSTTSSNSKSPKRLKELAAFFDMAEERGLFTGDTKHRTVNNIVEDMKMTKKQIAEWKMMATDSLLEDSDSDDDNNEDGDDDGGMSTYEMAIAKLKQRMKALKSELKNHAE